MSFLLYASLPIAFPLPSVALIGKSLLPQHSFMKQAVGGGEAIVKINQEAKKSALDCSQLPF